MRILTTITGSLLFAVTTFAQTYFYIDAIAIQPSDPTTIDQMTIELSGGLSGTGAYIASASASVQGGIVSLTISAADDGGATVIVPHTESILLGFLPEGEYMIEIDGNSILDLAPNGQHFFEVTAGDPCDALDIDFVQWAPFSDTALIVRLYNIGPELVGYPGFVLMDASGDTLAVELVNSFSIDGESYHELTVHPGAVIPEGPFMGELHLWTWFFGELTCTWDLEMDLCPPAPCDTLYPTLQNFGNALTLGDFSWSILNEEFEVVGSGTFTLIDTVQFDFDTLCLAPGSYSMHCSYEQDPTGGQPYFGVASSAWSDGPRSPLLWDSTLPLEFDFLPGCVDGTNGVQDPTKEEGTRIRRVLNGIELGTLDGSAIGAVQVFSADGKLLRTTIAASNTFRIDLQHIPDGVMIVRTADKVQRFVWSAP
ncbi:MAG: hypothetical protein IPL64_13165 [Flavobacteriales bacterium]|nr:hypothetical protein [Flavobacteriales bacterium]MCC6910399.1 hypothetical protein [Flavobacteriales bacterium]